VLSVAIPNREVWSWIGTAEPIDSHDVSTWAKEAWSSSVPLGISEPAQGPVGWRRTHAQARAAARIADMSSAAAIRYQDVAFLACASSDPLLLASVGDLYLRPLGSPSKQRDVLCKTLLVYFAVDENSISAAAVLGVSRQTVSVSNRLKAVEKRLGQPLKQCAHLLHAALRLEELGCLDAFDETQLECRGF
jgi:DNA-binding PucR family transcriptional regulator